MSSFITKFALALSLSLMIDSQISAHELCSGFAPANDLKIPVGAVHHWALEGKVTEGGLTEEQFNAVIDRFERLYRDEFSKAGGTLRVIRGWDDGTVNASANRSGSTWNVKMFGGLARHPAATIEGFTLVLCHEGGHHLGGAPKYSDPWGARAWATNEGGADYFATLKCLRRFFAEDDNEAIIAKASIDSLAKERCEKQFTQRAEQLICMRSSLASLSAALILMDIRKETKPPAFGTPDTKVATQMQDGHPATQCRMDTYFAGATCHVDVNIPVSNTDYREGSCVEPQDTVGVRPLCWFKP